jgi:CheY-like chemotaxis protein
VVLHFRVTDTGIGIPRDKHEIVFEPFAQADGSAGRRHGGTGLGLSISRRLVNLMRGDLWVESAAGEGATFRFTATFARSSTAGPEAADGAALSRVVLIAEDDRIHRRLLTAMLASRGHHVIATSDGREALEALSRERVHAALFDVQMPGLDGLRATESIRAWERVMGGHLPILGMTASVLSAEEERSRESGMDHVVTKPISRETLLGWIDALPEAPAYGPVPHELAGRADLLATVDGDLTAAGRLVGAFIDESPALLERIHHACEADDAEGVRRALQALGRSLGRLPRGEARILTEQIEAYAGARDLASVRPLLPRLTAELHRLREVLPALVRAS